MKRETRRRAAAKRSGGRGPLRTSAARSVVRGPEPWPGDLYMLAETADFPVEWLVVERTSGHCRLVAADTNPARGSADVPVPADVEGGPLSVRCAVSLQVGVETLRRGERTGTVAPEVLERCAAVWKSLRGSPAPGSMSPMPASRTGSTRCWRPPAPLSCLPVRASPRQGAAWASAWPWWRRSSC